MKTYLIASVIVLMTFILTINAKADEMKTSPLDGIKLKSLAYIDYSNGKTGLVNDADTGYNQFSLTRGYFTLEKELQPWMGMRLTMDLTQDDDGDYKVRQKYFYAALKPKDLGFLTGMSSEIGLGHIPWLDFEEHINPYRCQGTMAIERAGVLNSADVGISLMGSFGGKLTDAKSKTGNDHYDGLYGSWHIGIYNGSGYHAKEVNENKVPEARVTLRPLPEVLPGLQLSYFGVFGKGNTLEAPDYIVNMGMISLEHPMVILTGQFMMTEGNAKGTWIDESGKALKTQGFSAFGQFRIPDSRLAVFGRVDYFDTDADNVIVSDKSAYTTFIGGLSYSLYKSNMILVTFETTDYDENVAGKGKIPAAGTMLGKDQKVQMVYQISF
nr:hypothetical protein [candidate division Zixibacteria bacterium]